MATFETCRDLRFVGATPVCFDRPTMPAAEPTPGGSADNLDRIGSGSVGDPAVTGNAVDVPARPWDPIEGGSVYGVQDVAGSWVDRFGRGVGSFFGNVAGGALVPLLGPLVVVGGIVAVIVFAAGKGGLGVKIGG